MVYYSRAHTIQWLFIFVGRHRDFCCCLVIFFSHILLFTLVMQTQKYLFFKLRVNFAVSFIFLSGSRVGGGIFFESKKMHVFTIRFLYVHLWDFLGGKYYFWIILRYCILYTLSITTDKYRATQNVKWYSDQNLNIEIVKNHDNFSKDLLELRHCTLALIWS